MKKFVNANMRTATQLGVAAALALNFQVGDSLAGWGNGAGTPIYQSCSSVSSAIVPTAGEAEKLAFMREEEKLARDVYRVLYLKWQLPVFNNIALSEQSHMDQVKCLLDAYAVPDPAKAEAGQFNNPLLQGLYDSLVARGLTSPSEALRVGGMIEEVDIRDLQAALASSGITEMKILYGNLLAASAKHLRAFAANLANLGETYTSQMLPETSITAFLTDDRSVAGSAIDIANGKPLRTQARFTMRLDTGIAMSAAENQLTQQTQLTLSSDIQVDPAHIGQTAQLVNVVLYQAQGARAASAYQMTVSGGWQAWDGDLRSLRGDTVQLQASHGQRLYQGNFQNRPGYYQLYCGYLLGDGSLVLSGTPMTFGISP